MHRPRLRRKDPQRTGPIRNAGGAWHERDPDRAPEEPADDPVSAGVRAGYRVIEEQIRRGRRMAQGLDDEPRTHEQRQDRDERRRSRYPEEPGSGHGKPRPPYERGPLPLLGMPMRHLERLLREILRQIGSARPDPLRLVALLFQLQIEAFSELTRLGFSTLGMAAPRWGDPFEEDADRITRDIDETLEEIEDEAEDEEEDEEGETWDWPAPPSVQTVIRSSVPIPVYVWSHEPAEIELDLPPRERPLDLEVEPPLAIGTGEPPVPAFEAEFVALADGPVILRVEVPRELPAGLYRRRVVTRATGEPVGTLTVQAGTIPKASSTVSRRAPAKTSPKVPAKPSPRARKP